MDTVREHDSHYMGSLVAFERECLLRPHNLDDISVGQRELDAVCLQERLDLVSIESKVAEYFINSGILFLCKTVVLSLSGAKKNNDPAREF